MVYRLFILALLIYATFTARTELELQHDPCFWNPCEHNCSCELVPEKGDVRYRCVGSNVSCTWESYNVDCSNDQIQITLPGWLVIRYAAQHNVTVDDITNALYVSRKFNPDDKHCKVAAEKTTKGDVHYSFTIPAPFTACGTLVRIEGESQNAPAIFTNQVWFEKTVANYGFPVQLQRVRCSYSRAVVEKSLINPVCCATRPFKPANGTVGVQMYVWPFMPNENTTKQAALAFPISLPIGQKLFVTVESGQAQERNLTLLDCYVSTHFSVGKDFNSVDIIKDRCTTKSSSFRRKILTNGRGIRSLFMFEVFDFADFYIHCHAKLCKEGCQCSEQRKRRSGAVLRLPSSGDLHRDLTKGPIHVAKQRIVKKRKPQTKQAATKTHKAEERFLGWMVPTLLAISNVTCVALLGALCYALGRSLSSRRNRRLRQRLKGTPIGELFSEARGLPDRSSDAGNVVQLLKVKPQFDFARQCSMLTPPTSPDRANT